MLSSRLKQGRPDDTQCSVVQLMGVKVNHIFTQKYLGITLDPLLTFRMHIEKLQKKLKTRMNLVQKLAETEWWGGGRCFYSENGNNRVSVFYSRI